MIDLKFARGIIRINEDSDDSRETRFIDLTASAVIPGCLRGVVPCAQGGQGAERMVHYGLDISEALNSVPDLHTRSLDEPIVVSRVDPGVFERSRYYKEWVRPQGVSDAIQLTVLRQHTRLGAFAMSRHESAGITTDREFAILLWLAPHIRRAIAISDVLDMRAVEIDTFEASLDLIATGILLVDGNATIIHANKSARAMLSAGSPIRPERELLRF